MRSRFLIALFLLLQSFVFLFSSAASAVERGLLWKATLEDKPTIYLFGTIHSDDPRVNEISPALDKALSDSDIFALEILPPSNTSVYFMKEERLDRWLNAKELSRVKQLAELHAMEEEVALTLKPWLLAMVFDLPKPQSTFTLDAKLLTMARRESKSVIALESNDTHFTLLDDLPMVDQVKILQSVLKRTQKQKTQDFETLIKSYLSADIQRIASLDEKMTGSALPTRLWQQMRTKLIDQRNQVMADGILDIAQTQSVFVAVGAAHLPGNDGLINRLRKVGYLVSPVATK